MAVLKMMTGINIKHQLILMKIRYIKKIKDM